MSILRKALYVTLTAAVLPGATQGQQLGRPTFRPSDGPSRAARIVQGLTTLNADLRALRRVFVDSSVGLADWVEFEASALGRVSSGNTPEGAVVDFLARYGGLIYGLDAQSAGLALVARYDDGAFTHFRYAQQSQGRQVLGGDLLVHVARVGNRYAVQSVNGRVYPGIDVSPLPSLSYAQAREAALAGLMGAALTAESDSMLTIVPDGTAFRLTYIVGIRHASRGLLMRYVDAHTGTVFGEASGAISLRGDVAGWGNDELRGDVAGWGNDEMPLGHGESSGALSGYVAAFGPDAFGNVQHFHVWMYSASDFALASNDNVPGVTEVRIADFRGADIGGTACSTQQPIVRNTVTTWDPDSVHRREEVSGVWNVSETIRFYNTKFGRLGMKQPPTSVTACVHGVSDGFNAIYYVSTRMLGFRRDTDPDKASVAGQDVVTHEFEHGVIHADVAFNGDNENDALNEGLADYFGTRHRGSSCVAQGVYLSDPNNPCLRQIDSDSTFAQRTLVCGGDFHCLGVTFSSAVWRVASTTPWGPDTDWGVYNGVRYYMSSTVQFVTGREAVVRAVKDRAHNNQGTDITLVLEPEFYNRGIGPAPVSVGLARGPCSEWAPRVAGADARTFALRFEAGSSYNADGSADLVTYGINLGTYTASSLPIFQASQVAGHAGNDGHSHSFRFRFTDVGTKVGFLDYYAGDAGCGIQTVIAAHDTGVVLAAPREFAVRQAVQTPTGVLSARVAGPRALTSAAVDSRAGASVGAQVRAFGITALEIDVPNQLAGKRIDLAIYDLQGRSVRHMTEDGLAAGVRTITWDQLTNGGARAPAGVYVVVVRYGDIVRRTRFVVPAGR